MFRYITNIILLCQSGFCGLLVSQAIRRPEGRTTGHDGSYKARLSLFLGSDSKNMSKNSGENTGRHRHGANGYLNLVSCIGVI